ncbi:peptidoglycan-binding protein LysM [Puniceibacterium sp. IMCC21224]|uniref:peptidoglycan-binding protein LysM n=1 Tax=Puniceibacterium sp. IMCC21224 TaxID=1618204 RepID=UPI00064D76D8|nr:peptidoglycan-binding protein LysM [Puniceibacterium sp. IMCC21224]KMK68115.1 putative phospholipid-binding protein,LysM domain-containing protein [Puniceibacterium sp. IMCC21224]
MGLFNFWKKSGKSLVGGGDAAPSADALKKEVADLGLDTKGAEITVEGDKVKVSGGTLSAEEREKVILAVGNVEGVAEVEDDAADTAVFHTVEKGDTLSAVAKKTLGNANRYHEIFEANRPMLTSPDKIYPGQVLRIPQDASA